LGYKSDPSLTDANPLFSENGSGIGVYNGELTGLSPGTTYYVRAYATNSAGTSYGEQRSFTTLATLPIISTSQVSSITSTSVECGGDVTADGGAVVTARGLVWGTDQNPTIHSNTGITNNGSSTGSFTSNITGLMPGTTYYVRAYATNSVGTSYGEQRGFTTLVILPTISMEQVTLITARSAVSGGNVTASGGATVTARGLVYGTGQNPTVQSNSGITNNGSGMGLFTSNIIGLNPNTKYYVRAYATNSAGTSYGQQYSSTTLEPWNRDTETVVINVTSPATGKVWMDRNLGASRAATSSTDTQAYGDLYQWGRGADGHQKRNSPTTSTLSSTDQPGHGSFILVNSGNYDWRSPQNNNLWQGANGVNNPCPVGYRLPTEAEWEAERASWSSSNAAGAFASPLKLPLAGFRNGSSGSLFSVGSYGLYWSSSVSGTNARYLNFVSSGAGMRSNARANGNLCSLPQGFLTL
jgi:hypothetical protein